MSTVETESMVSTSIRPPIGKERGSILPSLLRALREKKKGKRSGSEVARAVGVWQSYVVKVETGKAKPTPEYIDGLCTFLELAPAWRELLTALNQPEDATSDGKAIRGMCGRLLPTRILLGPRATFPIVYIPHLLYQNPMMIVTREYIDVQLAYFQISDPHKLAFFKKNPNPQCYSVSKHTTRSNYLNSILATDYQLFEDVLLVSDNLYFLQFDAGDAVSMFIEQFELMRQHLEPYFPD